VWLPWHLPELISDPSQRPPLQFAILVMAQSVLRAWLYNNTSGSLPVVMLFHAMFNSFAQFLLAGVEGTPDQTAWWVTAVLTALIAVVAIWRAGSRSPSRVTCGHRTSAWDPDDHGPTDARLEQPRQRQGRARSVPCGFMSDRDRGPSRPLLVGC
jgi:hypothetical protein